MAAAPTIVFVHGRGQEFKNPEKLRTHWLAGLNAGLTEAGLPLVDRSRTVLPFYGNVLYRITGEAAGDRVRLESLPSDEPGPLDPATPADVDEVERQLLADMATAAGIRRGELQADDGDDAVTGGARGTVRLEGLREDILSWKASRQLLTLLAKRTRVDQLIIAAQLRDVAMYLSRAREAVLDVVRAELPKDGPLVIVGHSLGSVVTCDLLCDEDVRDRTVLWVTAGSPLGLEAVQRNLRSPGRQHPGTPWLTTYDVNDIVALGHPLQPTWGTPLTDVEAENANDPHSIFRYLSHPTVAAPIGNQMAST